MKKIIFSVLILAVIGTVTIYSCKKETSMQLQPQNISDNFNVTAKNGLLIFKTTDDYRNVVDNSSPEQMLKFVNEVKGMKNFTPYSESMRSDATNKDLPPFLQAILNKDAAVQIGNYIYKIDMGKEKVFALQGLFMKTSTMIWLTKTLLIQTYFRFQQMIRCWI
jgi:hypothetical protein